MCASYLGVLMGDIFLVKFYCNVIFLKNDFSQVFQFAATEKILNRSVKQAIMRKIIALKSEW